MGRPRFDDIVKRKIPGAEKIKKIRRIEQPSVPEPLPPAEPRKVARNSRYMLWSVAAVSIAFLLLALSFLWSSAEAEIYPKTEAISLSDSFSAASAATGGELNFELVALSGEKSKTLEATEEKEVSQKATGIAVIFNTYSTAPQRLDIDTRLLGSNGKLYKTKVATTVPGMKGTAAGSVEVPLYAAEAGEAFNSGPLDFNIVGFKGTPKYEKFKVRSKANTEITGGFVGKTKVASEADKQAARTELEAQLKEELYQKSVDQIPPGFLLFRDATQFAVDKIELPMGEEELKATLHGTLYGILLNKEELSDKIAEKKAAGAKKGETFVSGLKDLKFTLLSPAASFQDLESVSFRLDGEALLVWTVDAEKFTGDILGRSKKDFTSLLTQYENIDRVELTLSPIWKRTVPNNADKVEVIVKYPEEK